MYRRSLICTLSAIMTGGLLAGCQKPACDMQGQGGPPPRPAELDQLDKWVGTWTTTCDMKMYTPQGEMSQACSGREEVSWGVGNRWLASKCEYDMGKEMGKMEGLSLMTWCPKSRKYKSAWFDSWGGCAMGEMWWDAGDHRWEMTGRGIDGMTGKARASDGWVKFVDDNTMEWTFNEYEKTAFGKKKTMEMKGTSKRG